MRKVSASVRLDTPWTVVAGLLGLFLLGQGLVTWGIDLPWQPVLSPDSGFYLKGAATFPDLTFQQRSYSGFILLLWLYDQFGSAPWLAVVGNSVLVLLAAGALYRLTLDQAGRGAAWVAAAIWLVNPITAQWTRYVLTDPVYDSCVVLVTYLALRPGRSTATTPAPLPVNALLLAAIAASLRPNGFILLLALLGWLLLTRVRPRRRALAILLGSLTLLFCLLFFGPAVSPERQKIPRFLAQGVVIHSAPILEQDMPPLPANATIQQVPAYALHHPLPVLRLMLSRVAWEYAQVRPWYSWRYNLYNGLFMLTFYSCAWVGWRACRDRDFNRLVLMITLLAMAIVALTWAIWEGRFAWWSLVVWIPWAAAGAVQIGQRLIRRESPASRG